MANALDFSECKKMTILGKTKCPDLRGRNAGRPENGEFSSIPVGNELDPLYLFHDSAFHEECFRRHPLAETPFTATIPFERCRPRPHRTIAVVPVPA